MSLKYSPVVKDGIPNLKAGSKEYKQYWATQIDRCRNGYKPHGGVRINGAYYFYLNFAKILLRDDKTNRKKLANPWYRDLDHEYFDRVYQAKDNGRGLIILKARDKGFSFMNANLLLYEWTFFPTNEIGVGAATPSYVSSFRKKIIDSWNGLPKEFRLRKDLYDNEVKMMSGYKSKENGVWVEKGLKSVIHFRCMDNPDSFRGERLGMMIFEEAGEFKKLQRAYMSTEACFRDGAIQYGVPIIGGTSNTMNESEDYMKMWYEAETYNLDQFFIPASKALSGYFDMKTGKSDEINARKYFEDWRQRLRAAKDKSAYYLHIQEYPLEPEDAFMNANRSPFDLEKINNQKANILSSTKIKGMIQRYTLEWENKSQFKVKATLDMENGKFVVVHTPLTSMAHLDIAATDSYFQADAPNSPSKGCTMIFRRFVMDDKIESELPIAFYMDRPYTKEEWYENNLKLLAWYNTKSLVEYNDEGFFDYFVRNKATKFLKERPRSADSPWSKVSNRYGVHMKTYQKNLVIDLIDDYVKTHSDRIYFLELLEDLSNFGIKNVDMAMAFGIVLLHNTDNDNLRVRKVDEEKAGKEYFLPTFKQDSEGRMTVINSRNFNTGRNPNDPLGILQ